MAASVNKRTTESKYVSVFADARPDVDVTFRDVLLQRPTNHYLVGVDNMSLCSSQMSMIEPQIGDQEALIRICRKPAPVAGLEVTLTTLLQQGGALLLQGMENADGSQMTLSQALAQHGQGLRATLDADLAPYETAILTQEIITTVQQLMHRLNEVADSINTAMHTPGLMPPVIVQGGVLDGFGYVPDVNADDEKLIEHLSFSLGHDGRISITGTKAFWSAFVIEIPAIQYQHGFYGTLKDEGSPLRRYMVVDPETGNLGFDTMLVERFPQFPPTTADPLELAQNTHALSGTDPRVLLLQRGASQSYYDSGNDGARALRMDGANAVAKEKIKVRLQANTFSTLDRRVAIEMGCSLPIKNSPMIDHQKETPDFVLGRWLYQPDTTIETAPAGTADRYTTALTNNVSYQKAADRVVYHELMPQQKIQTLRLMLFARVRAFDDLLERWSMRVIELPTNATDWWHARLHFVSKD